MNEAAVRGRVADDRICAQLSICLEHALIDK